MNKMLNKITIKGDISYMVKVLEYSENHMSKIEKIGFSYSEQDECTEELFSIHHGLAADDNNLEIKIDDSISQKLVLQETQIKNEEISLPDGKFILLVEKLSNPVYQFIFNTSVPISNINYLTTSVNAVKQPRFIENLERYNVSESILSDGVSFDFSDSIEHQIFVVEVIDKKLMINQRIGE